MQKNISTFTLSRERENGEWEHSDLALIGSRYTVSYC